MKPLGKRVTKFLISGGCAAATEYGMFLLLVSGLPLFAANSISFLGGLAVSFFLNKRWVFLNKGRMTRQIVLYVTLAGVNLLTGNMVIWLLVENTYSSAMLAKIIVMILIAIWNYLLFSRIIFKSVDNRTE
jgi:putative flippase GtrA